MTCSFNLLRARIIEIIITIKEKRNNADNRSFLKKDTVTQLEPLDFLYKSIHKYSFLTLYYLSNGIEDNHTKNVLL